MGEGKGDDFLARERERSLDAAVWAVHSSSSSPPSSPVREVTHSGRVGRLVGVGVGVGVGVVGLVRAVRIWERVERVVEEGCLLGMIFPILGRNHALNELGREMFGTLSAELGRVKRTSATRDVARHVAGKSAGHCW